MNSELMLQAYHVPHTERTAWSFGHRYAFWRIERDLCAVHAHEPARHTHAVGLALFCDIAPIWGYQMITAAAHAHLLRLNTAIALVASNISIPPVMPFILYGGLALGHWLFTGERLKLSAEQMTRARVLEYLGEWCVGSLVLGALVAMLGMLTTYAVARIVRRQ